MNYTFTIIFTIDMGLKIIGLGIIDYIKDKMVLKYIYIHFFFFSKNKNKKIIMITTYISK